MDHYSITSMKKKSVENNSINVLKESVALDTTDPLKEKGEHYSIDHHKKRGMEDYSIDCLEKIGVETQALMA